MHTAPACQEWNICQPPWPGGDFCARRAAFEDAVYAPTGFFLEYQAWRRNVSGIVKGPLPFFWGVSKAA